MLAKTGGLRVALGRAQRRGEMLHHARVGVQRREWRKVLAPVHRRRRSREVLIVTARLHPLEGSALEEPDRTIGLLEDRLGDRRRALGTPPQQLVEIAGIGRQAAHLAGDRRQLGDRQVGEPRLELGEAAAGELALDLGARAARQRGIDRRAGSAPRAASSGS